MVNDPTDRLDGIPGASVSAFATALDGEVLASRDPERALAPASNTKLVTTALALAVLGPDHTFETTATGRGSVRDGHLRGDLVLSGSGAPDLARSDLAELARRVAERLDVVEGDLVLDGRRFTGRQVGPGRTVGDQRHAYGARTSALALGGNVVEVRATDATGAGDFEIRAAPNSEALDIRTDLATGDGELRVYTDTDTDAVRVEGCLPAGAERTERAPVPDPERHCGAVFRDALDEAGVRVTGDLRTAETAPRSDGPAVSAAVSADPVSELLPRMNRPSDNFLADQLARAVAAERGDGSWADWERVATDYLEATRAGPCRIRDGSGLSRYNLLTARGVVELLERAAREPWAEQFFESLPEPGVGTLASRLDDVSGLRAKTGTLTGASALSGIIRGDGSPPVVFSVLFGGLTGEAAPARERQDEFVRALARERRSG